MQTRTYGDLFKLIQSLAGVSTFAPTETDDIANLINRRYNEAYNTIQMWPRYLVQSDERNLAVVKVEGFTLANQTIYNGLYFDYGDDSNGNSVYIPVNANGTDGDTGVYINKATLGDNKFWRIEGGSYSKNLETGLVTVNGEASIATQEDTTIDYDNPWDVIWDNDTNFVLEVTNVQTVGYDDVKYFYNSSDTKAQKTTIGEPIRVHRKQPFLNYSAIEYDFFSNEDGINILNISNLSDASVFVTYKKKFVPFTTSSDYATSTEAVPGEFFHYIAHAAYSDFLRMDGQHDKAQLEQQNAQQYLALELERVDVIMNQTTVNKRFSTHVNRQSR